MDDRKPDGKTRATETCKSTEVRAGEETDRATWSRKIISHTGDPIIVMKGTARGKEEEEEHIIIASSLQALALEDSKCHDGCPSTIILTYRDDIISPRQRQPILFKTHI